MRIRVVCSTFFTAVLLVAGSALAATYYVAPGGNNANSGSLSAPWKTIQHGLNRMSSGDTLVLRGGTYHETVTVSKPRVTIKNHSGEAVVMDGREQIPTATWGALISINAADVTVQGIQLYRSKARGVAILPGAHRSRCSNLKISYCWRQGFAIAAGSSFPADVILENSEIFRNEKRKYYYENPTRRPDPHYNYGTPWGASVSIVGGLKTIIRNNKIYESYNEGLGLCNNTANALVENNEIWGNTVMQVYVSSSKLCTIRDNVIYGTASWNGSRSALGAAAVWLGGETWAASSNKDYGHRVYGNFLANSRKCVWIAGQAGALTRNSYVYNNVLVEALPINGQSGVNLHVELGVGGTGNVFMNNAVLQTKPLIDVIRNPNRVAFSSNLWNQSPSQHSRGNGDLVSSVALQKDLKAGNLIGGSLKKQDFSLKSSTVSKDRGTWLTNVNMPGGATNSTKIVVKDAGFFHGDEELKFSNGKVTTIKSVSGNTLTVSPAVTVAHGAGLALNSQTSSKPNIGPWSFTSSY